MIAAHTALETDLAWFRLHNEANFRVRRPGPGEVAQVARGFGAGAYYELAMVNGELPPPTRDVEWKIMVIRVEPSTLVRMLTLQNIGTEAAPTSEFSCYAVAAFQRVAIDRRA